ncbi:hypothetical protein VM1G_11192 [Cytospora mali]|uniref:EthD domain-containing protein n=1 Tax=Cytospora mali TaxID=578113 RepID=A0A194VKK4_CYTMA|nr:hypothetical protein VM1G_11192 [Valsa mali]
MAEQQNQQAQAIPLLKFSAHHYRAEGVDEQAFAKWYQEEQIPRMMNLLKKHGIDRYKLYITPASLRSVFQEDLVKLKGTLPGWKMAPFDVTSSYWVTDPDKLRGLLSDPDWEGKVVAFEKDWIDTSKAEVQIGWESTYLEDGEIVNVAETKEYD